MPRLFGFVPTKKMLEEAKALQAAVVVDEPIMESVLEPSIELPT